MPSVKRKRVSDVHKNILYDKDNEDAAYRIKRMRICHEGSVNFTTPEESHEIQVSSRNGNNAKLLKKRRKRNLGKINMKRDSKKCFTLYDCRGSSWTVTSADQNSKCNSQSNFTDSSSRKSVLLCSDSSDNETSFDADGNIGWKKSWKSDCKAMNNITHNIRKVPKGSKHDFCCGDTKVYNEGDFNFKSGEKSHPSRNYIEFKNVMHICRTGENAVLFQVGKQLSEKQHTKRETIVQSEFYDLILNGSKESKQKETYYHASDNELTDVREECKTEDKSFKNMKKNKIITCIQTEEYLSSKSHYIVNKKKRSKKRLEVKKVEDVCDKSKKERGDKNKGKEESGKVNEIITEVLGKGKKSLYGVKPDGEIMTENIDQQGGEHFNNMSNAKVMRQKGKKSKKRLKPMETEGERDRNKGEKNRYKIKKGEETHLRVKGRESKREKEEKRIDKEAFEVQNDVPLIESEETSGNCQQGEKNICILENIGKEVSQSSCVISDQNEEEEIGIIKKRVTRMIIESDDEEGQVCIEKNVIENENDDGAEGQEETCHSSDDDYEDSFIDDGSDNCVDSDSDSDSFINVGDNSFDDNDREEGEKGEGEEDDSDGEDNLEDMSVRRRKNRMAMQFFDDEAEEGEETEDEDDLEEEEDNTENKDEEDCEDSEDSEITGVGQFIDNEAVEDVPIVRRKKTYLVIDSEDEEEEAKKEVDLESLEKTMHVMKKLSRMMTVGERESAAVKERKKKSNEDEAGENEETGRGHNIMQSIDVNSECENVEQLIQQIHTVLNNAKPIKSLKKKRKNIRVLERDYVSDTEYIALKELVKEGI